METKTAKRATIALVLAGALAPGTAGPSSAASIPTNPRVMKAAAHGSVTNVRGRHHVSNVARAQDLKKERQSLLACYAIEAMLRGSQSCDSPTTLLHAVFEKCLAHERALQVALLRLRPGDVVFAENAIKHVRERMSPRIQRAIRHVQTLGEQCS